MWPWTLLQRHRTVLILTAILLFLLLTFESLSRSDTQIRDYLREWPAPSVVDSVQHSAHDALETILEYEVKQYESPFCSERFGRKYLENLRDSATGYCTPESPFNLTCFRSQTSPDARMDTLCFGKSDLFDSTDRKFHIECQLRELTKNETAVGVPKVENFASYWYETGPGIIFNNFLSLNSTFHTPSVEHWSPQTPGLAKNFTILIKREGAFNPWHCLMEIWSLTMTLDVLRMAIDPVTHAAFFRLGDTINTQIVILDDQENGPYFDLWTMFAQRPILRLKDLSQGTQLENIIVPLAGASNPVWQGDWDIHACGQSELLRAFVHRVLDFYHIDASTPPHSGDIVLTFIDRRDSRRLIDQDSYLEHLRARTPHVKVQGVDLAAVSFSEQLEIIRQTDVLVGVHGAGLTHGLFLPPESVMVEILPEDLNHKGFRNVAGLLGHSYLSIHASKSHPPDPIPPEQSSSGQNSSAKEDTTERKRDEWHTNDVFVEKDRFLEVAEVAIKILYNKGLRNYDIN